MSPGDYGGVIGQLIQFNTGDISKTQNITINEDQLCEIDPEEFFLSSMTVASGAAIDVVQPQARVSITDSSEPECGK